ncbi:MAG: DUF4127 family protein [Fimbriimonadaceae bacterium]|nr:DUF4127 family protein [Fimbriimonadaceae bacterium]
MPKLRNSEGRYRVSFSTVMRAWAIAILACITTVAHAQRILLVPLDSRPAAGQFSQMIGRMASVEVQLPPYNLLGRYTEPGKPDLILDWLEQQDFKTVDAIVISVDMMAYGGLIQSRVDDTSLDVAQGRLKRLVDLKRKHPELRLYAFAAIMRLFPTSTRANASWRLNLGRYAELKERWVRTKDKAIKQRLDALSTKIPPLEIDRYERTRARNMTISKLLLQHSKAGIYDYLIFGQDDAQPFGPHIPEQQTLKAEVNRLQIGGLVYQCEGIDQHSNILLSRALLKIEGWVPRVRIVYSDEAGKKKVANYESKNVETSLRDQLFASGARPMLTNGSYDYTLYVNTPDPRPDRFQAFLKALDEEIDQSFPVAVADINLGHDGTADMRLFDTIWKNGRMVKLLSYAGWNTAGNTMGTSIPAANIYLLARRLQVDPLQREVAQREFLLHRYVNDFIYHKYIRPNAYSLIDSLPKASREETFGEEFEQVDALVRVSMAKELQRVYTEQFAGKTFFAGDSQYVFKGLSDMKIFLPWPRAYEVRLEFRMETEKLGG